MNKERLDTLATWLEAGAPHKHVHFNMGWFLLLKDKDNWTTHEPENACGSVCCIAGCAAQFFAPEKFRGQRIIQGDIFEIAQETLGLNDSQAMALFLPTCWSLESITPEMAAKTIRRLIKTGRVNWKKANEK